MFLQVFFVSFSNSSLQGELMWYFCHRISKLQCLLIGGSHYFRHQNWAVVLLDHMRVWQRLCLVFLLAPICMQVINKHKTIIPLQTSPLNSGCSGTYVMPEGRDQDLNPPLRGGCKGLHQKPTEQQPLEMNKCSPFFLFLLFFDKAVEQIMFTVRFVCGLWRRGGCFVDFSRIYTF